VEKGGLLQDRLNSELCHMSTDCSFFDDSSGNPACANWWITGLMDQPGREEEDHTSTHLGISPRYTWSKTRFPHCCCPNTHLGYRGRNLQSTWCVLGGKSRVKVLSPDPQLLRLGQLLAKPRGVVPIKRI
jgi:hypothetical protein